MLYLKKIRLSLEGLGWSGVILFVTKLVMKSTCHCNVVSFKIKDIYKRFLSDKCTTSKQLSSMFVCHSVASKRVAISRTYVLSGTGQIFSESHWPLPTYIIFLNFIKRYQTIYSVVNFIFTVVVNLYISLSV